MEGSGLKVIDSKDGVTLLAVEGATDPNAMRMRPYLRKNAYYLTLVESDQGASKIITYDAADHVLGVDWSQVQTSSTKQLFKAVYDACEAAGVQVSRSAEQPIVDLDVNAMAGKAHSMAGKAMHAFVLLCAGVAALAFSLVSLVPGVGPAGFIAAGAVVAATAVYEVARGRRQQGQLKAAKAQEAVRELKGESSLPTLRRLQRELDAAGMDAASAATQAEALLDTIDDISGRGPAFQPVIERYERRYGWQVESLEQDVAAALAGTADERTRALDLAERSLSDMQAYLVSERGRVATAHLDNLEWRADGIHNLTDLDGVNHGDQEG